LNRLGTRRVLACAAFVLVACSRLASAQANVPKVPESVEALEGRRVLLIIIPERTPQTAYFIAGAAHWTGEALEVRPSPGAAAVVARGTPQALRPFRPTMLPKLIVPEHAAKVKALARGATACVVVFAAKAPSVGVALETPFFGLMRGADGKALLMQGDPSDR
jgi:hypothetical protein